MDHRDDIGPRPVDLAVNKPLLVTRGLRAVDGVAVVVVFDNVGSGHERWRAGAGEQVVIAILRAANAHVPVPVEHALVRQYVIGNH